MSKRNCMIIQKFDLKDRYIPDVYHIILHLYQG